MSNGDTRVDVSSEGEFHLRKAIELALIYHTGERGMRPGYMHGADSYMVRDNAIWFGWHGGSSGELTKFPARMGIDSLVAMALAWLKESGDYGQEPDCDGSVHRGWRLVSHFSLMPDCRDRFYLSFGVRPNWMEYHK